MSHILTAFYALCFLASLPEIPSFCDSGPLQTSHLDPTQLSGAQGLQPQPELGLGPTAAPGQKATGLAPPDISSHGVAARFCSVVSGLIIIIISFQHAAKSFPQRARISAL